MIVRDLAVKLDLPVLEELQGSVEPRATNLEAAVSERDLVLIEDVAVEMEPAANASLEGAGVVLLAPLFERGTFDDHQRLGRYGRGARSDLALERLVAELEHSVDVSAARFSLLGHSGGAQFVHRYVLAHPDRVSAAVASSAGWYTFPDPNADYPYGLDDIGELEEIRFAPDRFLKTPVLVIVGSLDVARGDSLRREIRVDRNQGRTRLERAQRWSKAMKDAARERAFDFLFARDRPGS